MDKTCSVCKNTKPVDEFYKEGTGHRSDCKSCHTKKKRKQYLSNPEMAKVKARKWRAKNPDRKRANDANWREQNQNKLTAYRNKYNLKYPQGMLGHNLKKYGITVRDYEELFTKQNGLCAICEQSCSDGRRLYVDHCHNTGKVRGLLCNNCNFALGHFKDQPALLLKAIKYLENYG